jgi:hypothetical protein
MKKIKWTLTLSLLLGLVIIVTLLVLIATGFEEGVLYLLFEVILAIPIVVVSCVCDKKYRKIKIKK